MQSKTFAAVLAAFMSLMLATTGVVGAASVAPESDIEYYLVTLQQDGSFCVQLESELDEPCIPETKADIPWKKILHWIRIGIDILDDWVNGGIASGGSGSAGTGGILAGVEGCSTAAVCDGSVSSEGEGIVVRVGWSTSEEVVVSYDYVASAGLSVPLPIPFPIGPCPFAPAPPCGFDEDIWFRNN